jgi:hypothetical protein
MNVGSVGMAFAIAKRVAFNSGFLSGLWTSVAFHTRSRRAMPRNVPTAHATLLLRFPPLFLGKRGERQ